MKCDKILERLNDYIDGEILGADAENVKSHLAECRSCSRASEELTRVSELMGRLPVLPAPAALMERVRHNLEHSREEMRPVFRYRWMAASLVSAAALFLLVITATIYWRQPAPDTESTGSEHELIAQSEQVQRINVSALNVQAAAEKIYELASLNFGRATGLSDYTTELNKSMKNESDDSGSSRVLKVRIPLSRRDNFISQVRASLSDNADGVTKDMEAGIGDTPNEQGDEKVKSEKDAGYGRGFVTADSPDGNQDKANKTFEHLAQKGNKGFGAVQSAVPAPGGPGAILGSSAPVPAAPFETVKSSRLEPKTLKESGIREWLAEAEVFVDIIIIVEPEIR